MVPKESGFNQHRDVTFSRLVCHATIMRYFQTEQLSRLLPSLYASDVNLNAVKHCRWVPKYRDGSAVEFIIFRVYKFVSA